MLEVIACGINIFCSIKEINGFINPTRYPSEVADLCEFISKDKKELPDYCRVKSNPIIPKRRNEY
jgi:hypothetical protein